MIMGEVAPARELMIALRDLVLATERYRLRVARASLGTGVIEMIALGNLAAEGPSTPTQMARRLQLATASVTALIDRLEHLGLVARRRHRTDRRKVVVDLSETGHNAAELVQGQLGAALQRCTTALTPEQRTLLLGFLHDVTAELHALPNPLANGR
jgi:DNA-binding MarR family transcriptional regulator